MVSYITSPALHETDNDDFMSSYVNTLDEHIEMVIVVCDSHRSLDEDMKDSVHGFSTFFYYTYFDSEAVYDTYTCLVEKDCEGDETIHYLPDNWLVL